MILKYIISLGLLGWAYGQQDNMKISMMDRQSLHEYSLAQCSDGSSAAYYIDKDTSNSEKRVMIYFDNSVDSFQNTIEPCTSVDECLNICENHPDACSAPVDATRILQDGLWSRETANNPFANYFKVYVPSCSLDDFSGARGPLRGSNGNQIYFHGRHIFSSLLRDLVANYGIDQAENIVLVGSGSGARGVGHGCDYLADAITNVNEKAEIRCVLDGPDLLPYWVHDSIAEERCEEDNTEAFFEETTKLLWGRTDDESCVRTLESQDANETTVAETCGIFSRYWRHVKTPLFVINSQYNQKDFERITCNVSTEDQDFPAYRTAWKQGITSLIEAMSIDQPANGWFIPNCQDETLFFSAQAIEVRKSLQIPLFVSGEEMNVLQVLNNWLVKPITDDEYQAIDQFGPANPICSANHVQKSAPLRNPKSPKNQRLVPFDPLDDVPKPKGFPDGPPPRPRDPVEDIFGVDALFGDRFFGRDDFSKFFPGKQMQKDKSDQKKTMGADLKIPELSQFDQLRDQLSGSPSGRLTDTDLLLGAELFKEQLAEQAERRQNQQQRLRGAIRDEYFDYNNLDTDILYRFISEQVSNSATKPQIPGVRADDLPVTPGIGSGIGEYTNTRYRSRFRLPYDLLYYRYNLYKQQTETQSGNDGLFDQVDPSTPDFFDYDYDINVNYGPGGSPLPTGVLPEQAVALSNSRSRKARLWRKVYYLQYLRELYRRTYADYYQDYYYGVTGNNGNGRLRNGRLTKKEKNA